MTSQESRGENGGGGGTGEKKQLLPLGDESSRVFCAPARENRVQGNRIKEGRGSSKAARTLEERSINVIPHGETSQHPHFSTDKNYFNAERTTTFPYITSNKEKRRIIASLPRSSFDIHRKGAQPTSATMGKQSPRGGIGGGVKYDRNEAGKGQVLAIVSLRDDDGMH